MWGTFYGPRVELGELWDELSPKARLALAPQQPSLGEAGNLLYFLKQSKQP